MMRVLVDDARLGGDLRLRLAWHLQNVSTWGTTGLVYRTFTA